MCRIESKALSITESQNASERQRHAEQKLLEGIESFAEHYLKRKGKGQPNFKLSAAERTKNLKKIRAIAYNAR